MLRNPEISESNLLYNDVITIKPVLQTGGGYKKDELADQEHKTLFFKIRDKWLYLALRLRSI